MARHFTGQHKGVWVCKRKFLWTQRTILRQKCLCRARIPLGLQHVFAMFVGNLTPLLIIMGACGIAGGEFAAPAGKRSAERDVRGRRGNAGASCFPSARSAARCRSSWVRAPGFIGVFNSVAATMGGGMIAYGAIMGASILGGLFETVLGFFLKPLRKFFPAVVTGTVVLSYRSVADRRSASIPSAAATPRRISARWKICCWRCSCWWLFWSSSTARKGYPWLVLRSCVGIIAGYIAAIIMGLVLAAPPAVDSGRCRIYQSMGIKLG